MDAWTEFDDEHGLQFEIVAEGGSGYVRKKVLRAALEGEQRIWAAREPQRASLTAENYTFLERGLGPEGLAAVAITPRRKDVLLVEGAIFVEPDQGDLRRIEGTLSKAPSFWTRRVEIVRRYERIAGVHRRTLHLQDDLPVRDDQRPARRRSASPAERRRHALIRARCPLNNPDKRSDHSLLIIRKAIANKRNPTAPRQ